MLGSPEGFADYIPMNQISKDMGGEKDFIWNHNDEEKWKEVFDSFPDITEDNWEKKN